MTGPKSRAADHPLALDRMERALARPQPFAAHDAPFWDDPHIARGMLAAHLDPGTDAASRRPDLDLAQHAVIDGASITTYRVWDRAYPVAGLRALLARHGLRVEAVWSDLAGTPYRRTSPTLGVLARRP